MWYISNLLLNSNSYNDINIYNLSNVGLCLKINTTNWNKPLESFMFDQNNKILLAGLNEIIRNIIASSNIAKFFI